MKSLRITRKEATKVTHDINNVWHARYQGLELGVINTSSNMSDSPTYAYSFINYGFNNYQFIEKKKIEQER